MQTFTLNDDNKIPAIGFGTFQIPPDGSTYEAVKTALVTGKGSHDLDAPDVAKMLSKYDVHAND